MRVADDDDDDVVVAIDDDEFEVSSTFNPFTITAANATAANVNIETCDFRTRR